MTHAFSLKHSGMMRHFLKGNLEPLSVMFGMQLDIFGQVVKAHVFPGFHLFVVDIGLVIALSNPDMVKFVLGKAFSDGCFIYKGVNFAHLAAHAHFFHKAA